MNQNKAIAPRPNPTAREEKSMEFVPFGAADKIKLSIEIIKKTVAVPTKSGALPTDRDCIRFMMLCQAQRLNPFAGDCFLTGYDAKNGPQFSLITSHVAFLKRAESCADFEGMESGVIICDNDTGLISEREGDFKLADENCVGGWAKVYRKGRKPTYRRLSIAAMLPPYDTPFWSEHKAPGMIVKCAEADALRATFPSLIGGLMSQEEVLDTMVSAKETVAAAITPSAAVAMLASVPAANVVPVNFNTPERETVRQAEQPDDVPMDMKLTLTESPRPSTETEQSKLEATLTAAGFTFKDWCAYMRQTGQGDYLSGVTGFSDLPLAVARRMNRTGDRLVEDMNKLAKGEL